MKVGKRLWIFPGNVAQVIRKISESKEIDRIVWYQTVIVSYIMTPVGLAEALINYYTRRAMGQPFDLVLSTSVVITLFSLAIQLVALFNMKRQAQIHMISLLSSAIVLLSAAPNTFALINPSWQILLIMLLIAVTRVDQVMFIYVGVCALLLNVWSYSEDITRLQGVGLVSYLSQLMLLVVSLAVGLIQNRIHGNLIKNDIRQIKKTEQQNQQLKRVHAQIVKEEKRLVYLSQYDPLTKLPNRRMFMEKLEDLCQPDSDTFAVVFIDLDNFKRINDTMGHHVGDLYLTEVSRRMKRSVRDGDILGRLGGDEFALIVHHYRGRQDVADYVATIRGSFSDVFTFGQYETRSTSSFGIAVYPDDAMSATELLKSADMALYEIKKSGKNDVVFFNYLMKDKLISELQLENDLTNALSNQELYLDYQPLFQLHNHCISGFEALLRWRRSNNEIIAPLIFIPIAEKMGMIEEIGMWVLRQACQKVAGWQNRYQRGIRVAVNISAIQMRNPLFAEHVAEIIRSEGAEAALIEFEITESVFINDIDQAIAMIQKLTALGVHVVLDDFGTGYSSLSYLKQLPIDTLKIDQSFMRGLIDEPRNQRIISSLIDMMHGMNIAVVTEGVEEESQLRYLAEHECDRAQGFFLSEPLNETELDGFLRQQVLLPRD
ncbi:MAG: bifunctional diguanylate cyclase/phosphodiesterase [Sporolactobacillus sp.]